MAAPCSDDAVRYSNYPVISRLIHLAIIFLAAGLIPSKANAQQTAPFSAAGSADLNYEQFGMLAIQDGGRRKPVDTFARESLIRITGRSIFRDKTGRVWRPNDFALQPP